MADKKLIIIGGGPAGLAAAISANDNGIKAEDILILERDRELGGILNQCIHSGFGLHRFGKEMTGPEYAESFISQIKERNIPYLTDCMATDLSPDKMVTFVSPDAGYNCMSADAIILAMGCRERPRGALGIYGSRPSGIYTAGTAQKYVNIEGYMPGKRVVILGSGDIGLIMARRMTLEGAKILAVAEIMPFSSGLARNISQCLDDFGIPLYLSHTVVSVRGRERLEGVVLAKVDENRRPIKGSELEFDCDTLLLSCGLIPENELSACAGVKLDGITKGAIVNESRMTDIDGIFACGNVLHVHDIVDFVSEEAEIAGKGAAEYILSKKLEYKAIPVKPVGKVRYTVPQLISDTSGNVKVYFRVSDKLKKTSIEVRSGDELLLQSTKPAINPSEMQYIILSGDKIKKALTKGEISVSATEI